MHLTSNSSLQAEDRHRSRAAEMSKAGYALRDCLAKVALSKYAAAPGPECRDSAAP
jgi:hypothetical protein